MEETKGVSFPAFFFALFVGMVSFSRTNIKLAKTSFCCAKERLQRSANAVKAQCMNCERRESAVKAS